MRCVLFGYCWRWQQQQQRRRWWCGGTLLGIDYINCTAPLIKGLNFSSHHRISGVECSGAEGQSAGKLLVAAAAAAEEEEQQKFLCI